MIFLSKLQFFSTKKHFLPFKLKIIVDYSTKFLIGTNLQKRTSLMHVGFVVDYLRFTMIYQEYLIYLIYLKFY